MQVGARAVANAPPAREAPVRVRLRVEHDDGAGVVRVVVGQSWSRFRGRVCRPSGARSRPGSSGSRPARRRRMRCRTSPAGSSLTSSGVRAGLHDSIRPMIPATSGWVADVERVAADHREAVRVRGGDVRGRHAVDEQDDIGAVVDRPADVVDGHHAAAPADAGAADGVVDLCSGRQCGGGAAAAGVCVAGHEVEVGVRRDTVRDDGDHDGRIALRQRPRLLGTAACPGRWARAEPRRRAPSRGKAAAPDDYRPLVSVLDQLCKGFPARDRGRYVPRPSQ